MSTLVLVSHDTPRLSLPRHAKPMYRTAASVKKLLRAQGLANTTFDLEESSGNRCQYREQVVIVDIGSDMLLGMS